MNENSIQRKTSESWVSLNPVLENGCIGIETDTGSYKIGDGITVWNEQPYAVSSVTDELGDSHILAMSQFGMTSNLSIINIPRLTQNNNTTLTQAINLIPDSYSGLGFMLLHRYDDDNYLYFYSGDATGRTDKTKYILMSTTFQFKNMWSLKTFSDLIDNSTVYVPENWAVLPPSGTKNSDLWMYSPANLSLGHVGRFRPFIKSSNLKLSPILLKTEIIELDKIIRCKWAASGVISDNPDYFMIPLKLNNIATYSTNKTLYTYGKVCAFTPDGEYLEWTTGNIVQTNQPSGTEYYYAGQEIDFNIVEGMHENVPPLQIPEDKLNIDWQTKFEPFEKASQIVDDQFTKKLNEILNGSAFIKGEGINTGGGMMYDGQYGCTDYIELTPGHEYCYFGYAGGSMQAVSLYDGNKNLVRQINSPNETTESYRTKLSFRATGNETFARFSYMGGDWVNNIISIGKYIYGNTVSALEADKNAIKVIGDRRGDSCKMQLDKGRFIDSFTITATGIDASVSKDQDITRWNPYSHRLSWKGSKVFTIDLNENFYGNQSIGFWMYISNDFFDGDPYIDGIIISLAKDNVIVREDILKVYAKWFVWPGWNFIRIDPDQIGCTCYNQLKIYFAGSDGSANMNYWVNIDSVVAGQRSKPVITLSYDDLWPETNSCGIYQKHKERNLPITISSYDFYEKTTDSYYDILKELIDSGIMEIGIYSNQIPDDTNYPSFKNKYDYFFEQFTKPQLKYPREIITCDCARNQITPAIKAVAQMCGAKMFRAVGLEKNCYIDRINNMITTNTFEGKFDLTKIEPGTTIYPDKELERVLGIGTAYIDDIIKKGYFGGFMAHKIDYNKNINAFAPDLKTPYEVWS